MIDFYEYAEMAAKANQAVSNYMESAVDQYKKEQYSHCARTIDEALFVCEEQQIVLREILFSFYSPTSKEAVEFHDNAAVGFDIAIEQLPFDFTAYKISLPVLLPNQRSRWQKFKETIGAALHYAIFNYCRENEVAPLNDCTVVFTTYINAENKVYVSDNDNKEAKSILNILSRNLICDDNGLLCDVVYRTRRTQEHSHTEVVLIEKDRLPDIYNQL